MSGEYEIPAAGIDNVDLDSIRMSHPDAAVEIERLGALLSAGEESEEDLRRLGALLHDVGEVAEAEYLLRRNLDVGDQTHSLYLQLFGDEKEKEFLEAIKAFRKQFDVDVELLEEFGFLDQLFLMSPGTPVDPELMLLGMPCEVNFHYSFEDCVRADVICDERAEAAIMSWREGIWEIAEDE